MIHKRLACCSVAGDDVHDAVREASFLADVRKGESRQRRELRGLQYNGIARGQRWCNLPRQHQQRKIPGNDLPDDSASGMARKFLREQLRPASVMIKMPGYERNINIAALANRFAIVQRLENGQPA